MTRHTPRLGAGLSLIDSLGRFREVVAPRSAALSLYSLAHARGVSLTRRKTYHRVFMRISGGKRVGRAETYGANKAAVVELERDGSAIVPCGNAAECMRVAARRIGFRIRVTRIGAGPFRKVEIVKPQLERAA